jgi:serine/threonine protein kinase
MTSTAQPPSAIEYLYDRGILHRDISIGNIMIAVDGSGRLIDLDLARDRDEVGERSSERTVSSHPQFV